MKDSDFSLGSNENLPKYFHLAQGFPTWGTCTLRDTFAYPKGYIYS